MECDTLLPQSLPNGHAPVYPYANGGPVHHEEDESCVPEASTRELLQPPLTLGSQQSLELQHSTSEATTLEDEILADLPSSTLSTPVEETNITMPFEDEELPDTNTRHSLHLPEEKGTRNTADG